MTIVSLEKLLWSSFRCSNRKVSCGKSFCPEMRFVNSDEEDKDERSVEDDNGSIVVIK